MARVSTYLNFPRATEEAFLFYRSVFGGEFSGGIQRFADIPAAPDQPPMAEADRQLVMPMPCSLRSARRQGRDAAAGNVLWRLLRQASRPFRRAVDA
jgi:hypothetical protein